MKSVNLCLLMTFLWVEKLEIRNDFEKTTDSWMPHEQENSNASRNVSKRPWHTSPKKCTGRVQPLHHNNLTHQPENNFFCGFICHLGKRSTAREPSSNNFSKTSRSPNAVVPVKYLNKKCSLSYSHIHFALWCNLEILHCHEVINIFNRTDVFAKNT